MLHRVSLYRYCLIHVSACSACVCVHTHCVAAHARTQSLTQSTELVPPSVHITDREIVGNPYFNLHKVRDLAAASWVLLAVGNATGTLTPANVTAARAAFDTVFAAQLSDGQ